MSRTRCRGFSNLSSTEHLEAELHVFKEAVGRFAKTQSDRVGDASVYVQTLLSRVQAHYVHPPDGQYNAQEMLEAFRQSVKLHLEQFFGFISLQIKGLD